MRSFMKNEFLDALKKCLELDTVPKFTDEKLQ